MAPVTCSGTISGEHPTSQGRSMTLPSGDAEPSTRPRRRRRGDARRNAELLLAAAKEVFDARGVDAPLDDVARRAGVGNATMYRHFTTRRVLSCCVAAEEDM